MIRRTLWLEGTASVCKNTKSTSEIRESYKKAEEKPHGILRITNGKNQRRGESSWDFGWEGRREASCVGKGDQHTCSYRGVQEGGRKGGPERTLCLLRGYPADKGGGEAQSGRAPT